MRLFARGNLLPLVLAQLLISLVLVEAGFFDQFNKKHKDNDKDKNKNVRIQDNDKEKKVASSEAEEAAKLAEELHKMDGKTNNVSKKPTKFSNLMAAAKEVDKFESESNENDYQVADMKQQAEVENNNANKGPPAQQPTSKPSGRDLLKNKILNSLHQDNNLATNMDKNNNSSPAQQAEEAVAAKDSSAPPSNGADGGGSNGGGSNGGSGGGAKYNTIRPNSSKSKLKIGDSSGGREHHPLQHMKDSKLLHAHYWRSEIKDAYHSTKDSLRPIGEKISELPAHMHDASEAISATLKLDSKGRLLAMINEVDEDIGFVRGQFSNFSQIWATIMEKSLSYIGRKELNSLSWNANDELDFRRDALNAAAFGYEFMRLMMAWRENLMLAHYTYRNYLEQVKLDFEKEKFEIKEDFMFQLETIHNYILLKAWMDLDNLSVEAKMKLDYLMDLNDQFVKNYESDYFRQIIVYQELYEPTTNEFRAERKQIIEALSSAGSLTDDQFKDVDEFIDEFKNDLANKQENNNSKTLDWEVPSELQAFMDEMEPELRYNFKVYKKSFLKDLKEAKEKVIEELYEKL